MKKIKLAEIRKINLRGKTIGFSTDTVFGVGALIDDHLAIEKIYQLKGRDYTKPLACLIDDLKYLEHLTTYQGDLDFSKFWPGPVTFVFEKQNVLDLVTSNLKTVGIRIPNSRIALTVLNYFGPMAVTSINLSGEKSATSLSEVEKFKIDYLICEEEELSGLSSTVIDLTTDCPNILRKGSISKAVLQKEIKNIN